MISWQDAQTLLAVAEHKSFSAAARHLGLGQATISRRIQRLENTLKQQLFIRAREGAIPTQTALSLIPAAEQMAKWAAEFDRVIQGEQQLASGTVKIAAPPGIAVEQLAPFAMMLKKLYPDITLEVLASIDHVDLARGVADLAIRSLPPSEPELVALFEATNQPAVYASRAYVANLPSPCRWSDISWVTWAKPYDQVAPRPMLEKLIENFQPVFTSDDYLAQKAAVKAGLGAMIMGEPLAFEEHDLVAIGVGVVLPPSKFYLVCAKSMQQVPRVSAVAEQLITMMENRHS